MTKVIESICANKVITTKRLNSFDIQQYIQSSLYEKNCTLGKSDTVVENVIVSSKLQQTYLVFTTTALNALPLSVWHSQLYTFGPLYDCLVTMLEAKSLK